MDKTKSFRQKDSLDKFLTIYLKYKDKDIETATSRTAIKTFIAEKELILSIAKFIRYIDNLSDDELLTELELFKDDKELEAFIVQCVKNDTSQDKYLDLSDDEITTLAKQNHNKFLIAEAIKSKTSTIIDLDDYVATICVIDYTADLKTAIQDITYWVEKTERFYEKDIHLYIDIQIDSLLKDTEVIKDTFIVRQQVKQVVINKYSRKEELDDYARELLTND